MVSVKKSTVPISKSGRNTPVIPTAAVGRFAARKPPSTISDVIHGATDRVYVETTNGTPEDSRTPAPEPPKVPTPEPEPESEPVPEVPASPSPERPTTLPVAPAVSAAPSPAGFATPRRDSQLTDQGYFDVKFYHNKRMSSSFYLMLRNIPSIRMFKRKNLKTDI
ncbi:alpha-tubulin N-acetyltransferase 1-like [Leguminivora glycinivorella]|uniref:alpha-tubulin N-acetyltransferase 1-like n=1 Tax=Leguminivora glycinivorella TaxID=1035111 RepID=UPI00200F3EA8|nr:alpha-tubulin N-acetyltransferase 1-like [Leguminivora glycinivorella]